MDDSRKAEIEELKTRIVQWERVHDHEVTGIRDENSQFKQTKKTAAILVGVGSIPSFARIVYWSFFEKDPDLIQIGPVATTFMATFALFVASAAAASASSLLAHFWFRRDAKRQRLATIFISLAAAASILGWVFVVTW